MARTKLDTIRLGPTTLTGGGVEETLGSVPLSTITSGMSVGDQVYVDVVVMIFVSDTNAYAGLVTLTVAIKLTSGPAYNFGTVTSTTVNSTGIGPPFTGANLDQNSGNLRVRVTVDGGVGYAVVNTMGP